MHDKPRRYSVGALLTTQGGREVRKRIEVMARSPQGARAEVRRKHPGWRPYNPRAI